MIKASELMLGNLVMTNSGPAKVTKLKDGFIYFEDRLGGGITFGVDGIPLSPEIMEKNWAGKWGKHSETIKSFIVPIDEHSNITFQVISGSSEVFFQYHRCGADSCEFRKNINHVHQLQQIFTICGIEKEITLDGISVKEG